MPPSRTYLTESEPPDNPDLPDRWREGKHLPHWDGRHIAQSLTFRLAGSVPSHLIHRWEQELKTLDEERRRRKLEERVQGYLDQLRGCCWLEHPDVAKCVHDALLEFDEERYVLHAWVIMPNHVHVLFTIIADMDLSEILHSWRSYTAQIANRILERTGTFWHDGYFDRYIRDDEHFWNVVRYIECNPVKARLCERPEDWKWGSARLKDEGFF